MIGTNLGHFRIVDLLGEGGMGEVYRAEDERLGREVAIKVLPPALVSDPERLARFEREARVLAALNHPNIAAIYEVGGGDGDGASQRYLVMELAPGETLSDRIARGRVPVGESIAIGQQIVAALEAAHAQGIVHRDLKPANVKVDADGRVKVLDFGLAKALESSSGEGSAADLAASPTLTYQATQAGVLLGTAAYMSPEQARGKPADRRSDIWAFGVVLHEMLTGERLFDGGTVSDILASVLKDEPDLDRLPSSLPEPMHRALRRCLAKAPRDRYHDIADVRLELDEALEPPPVVSTVERSSPAGGSRWFWPAVAGLAVVAAVVGWARGGLGGEAVSDPSGLRVVAMSQLTDLDGLQYEPALSPDGRQLAFVALEGDDEDIFLVRVGGDNPINLTADFDSDDFEPEFSPDGESIAFGSNRDGGGIFVMGATGESPRRVVSEGFAPAWSPDGEELAYTTERVTDPTSRSTVATVFVVGSRGGEPRALTAHDAAGPSWSPSGLRVAYWSYAAVIQGQRDIYTISSEGGEPVAVTLDAATDWDPLWAPDGRSLYFLSDRGGSPDLWQVQIDEATGKTTGRPSPVTVGIARVDQAGLSANGQRIAVTSSRTRTELRRAPFDPVGERLLADWETLYSTSKKHFVFDVSPDGEWISGYTQTPKETLFVVRADGTGWRAVLDEAGVRNRGPMWSPDGRWLLFYSNRSGGYEIWAIRSDGTGLRRVTETTADLNLPDFSSVDDRIVVQWSEDRVTAATFDLGPGGLEGLTTPLGTETAVRLPNSEFAMISWSPDGETLVGEEATGDAARRLVTYDLSSGELELVRDGSGRGLVIGNDFEVVWIDPGRLLVWDDAGNELVVWDRERAEIRPVAGVTDRIGPLLAPDGRTIYGISTEKTSDIWLLDLGTPDGEG